MISSDHFIENTALPILGEAVFLYKALALNKIRLKSTERTVCIPLRYLKYGQRIFECEIKGE